MRHSLCFHEVNLITSQSSTAKDTYFQEGTIVESAMRVCFATALKSASPLLYRLCCGAPFTGMVRVPSEALMDYSFL